MLKKRFTCRLAACLWGMASIAAITWGQNSPPASGKSTVEPDYSAELPRIKPVEPGEALRHFDVQPGYEIQQTAAEPLVTDPVAMSFDEQGRLYVVEMRDYSEQDQERLGRIRLLEDTDGDGRFDQSTVFAEDLSWPTAVVCFDGGVFVGAPPDIYYLKDTSGDRRADERRVVFTGFGRSNVQGLLNSFHWGLDNRIHGATSSSGGEVVRPDVAGFRPVPLRGRDFSFNPRELDLRAESGGAQHGLSFDDWGRKFVCSNSNHAQFVAFDDRYLARNKWLPAPSSLVAIADDGGQAPVFRSSPVEPWRIVRTRLRASGASPGVVEGGGKPAGYFTGATGITIYRGDAFPPEMHGVAIVGDVGSNIVHRKKLIPRGVVFAATRIDTESEFVRSDDIWFRPVQFANGPDGCLHILDMYREVIEHPQSLPPEIKKHLDLTSGRDRGRLYRVVPQGAALRASQKLGTMSSPELVELLAHANSWHRETASRLLFERQDLSVVSRLEDLVRRGSQPLGRLHALWVLEGLGQLKEGLILAALQDESPGIREHALRLAERFSASDAMRTAVANLAEDSDLRVQYQFAFSAGEFPTEWKVPLLARVLRQHGDDAWIRLAALSSLSEGANDVLLTLLHESQFRKSPSGPPTLDALCGLVARQNRKDDVARILAGVQALPAGERSLQVRMFTALVKGNPSVREEFSATGPKAFLDQILSDARMELNEPGAGRAARLAALATLKLSQDERDVLILLKQLNPAEPAELQLAAAQTLREFKSPEVVNGVLDRWREFTPAMRMEAEELVFSRPAWAAVVLDRIEAGKLAASELSPARLQALATSRDARLRSRGEALLKTLGNTSRKEIVEQYQPALELAGDVQRGRAIFRKQCTTCHRLEETGHDVGPNLATIRNRGKETILLNVLDPNREVNPQYLNFIVATTDGRSFSGMIQSESAASLTLVRADKQMDSILRQDIEQMRSTGLSLMPEGLEKQIDPQGLADVMAYLLSIQ